jgi:hypothetical protein
MKPTIHFVLILAAASLMTGCGAQDNSQATQPQGISLYKATGSRQCAPAAAAHQQRLLDAVNSLAGAGVRVLESSCGNDGLMHITLCGAETGEIWIVTVTPESRDKALAQGFRPLQEAPQAQSAACGN